jgi:hypothetical protein
LWKKGREIVSRGLVKASWVARLCGISERAVHAARRWMLGRKFLQCIEVAQHVLNRWGGCFVFSLQQEGGAAKRRVQPNSKRSRGGGASISGGYVVAGDFALSAAVPEDGSLGRNSRRLVSIRNSKLLQKEAGEFAPPYKQVHSIRSTSTTNQKDKPAFSGKTGFLSKKIEKPTLTNIQLEDLRRVPTLRELYQQAVAAKWLQHSEANLRNFISAAVRATRAGSVSSKTPGKPRCGGDPVRIFVGIVKKQLWHHITQEQEDRAVQVLKRYRDKQAAKDESKVSHILTELKTSVSMPLTGNTSKPVPIFAHQETISSVADAMGALKGEAAEPSQEALMSSRYYRGTYFANGHS